MIWQTILKKYSMLALGILMMTIFLNSKEGKVLIAKYRNQYIPSDCRALLDRTSKRLEETHADWVFGCENEVLKVKIPFTEKVLKEQAYRGAMYRDLANKLVLLSKISNEETMERVPLIRVHLQGEGLSIIAQTKGDELVKFQTLQQESNIIHHLQKSVKVKELIE